MPITTLLNAETVSPFCLYRVYLFDTMEMYFASVVACPAYVSKPAQDRALS